MSVTRAPASSAAGVRGAPALPSGRLRRGLETSPFPILLVSLVGLVLATVFAPALIVGDTWLTLMAGREIVEHGLPRTEEITVLGQGAVWTDQQWLAQLLFFGAHELAGMKLVVLVDIVLVVVALALAAAAARAAGASSRSTFLIGLLAVLAGPWGWTVRAQSAALPLFVAVLWLLLDAYRNGPRSRTLLVLPALVVWANLHGSVVLGAGLSALLAVALLVRDGRALVPAVLLVCSPLAVMATPYGLDVVAYYDLMLVDAPFAEILREWEWSKPSGTTTFFWLLAVVAIGLVVHRRCRERLTVYELLVLGITLVGAVQAVRGVIWFALACAAILPAALDGVLRRPDLAARRVNLAISVSSLAALGAGLLFLGAQPASWFVESWPEEQVAAVRRATRDPATRLWATDGTADWLLWEIPDLRGRIAYDVRFELYDADALATIVQYGRREGAWTTLVDAYGAVVVEEPPTGRTVRALLREPTARVAFGGPDLSLVVREPRARD